MPAQHLWLLVARVHEVNGALQGVWEVLNSELPGPFAAGTKLNVPSASSNQAATVQLGLGRR